MKIAPSILAADFLNLKSELMRLNDSKADWIHLDIMDGNFVPNITFGYELISKIRKETDLFLDCHLMIAHPLKYVELFCKSGANSISIHIETISFIEFKKIYKICSDYGVKIGIALNPSTELIILSEYIDYVNIILVMSVEPGFGGQLFKTETFERISAVKKMIGTRDILVQIDGGVTNVNAEKLANTGADVLVSGSYLFGGDLNENIKSLRGPYEQ